MAATILGLYRIRHHPQKKVLCRDYVCSYVNWMREEKHLSEYQPRRPSWKYTLWQNQHRPMLVWWKLKHLWWRRLRLCFEIDPLASGISSRVLLRQRGQAIVFMEIFRCCCCCSDEEQERSKQKKIKRRKRKKKRRRGGVEEEEGKKRQIINNNNLVCSSR